MHFCHPPFFNLLPNESWHVWNMHALHQTHCFIQSALRTGCWSHNLLCREGTGVTVFGSRLRSVCVWGGGEVLSHAECINGLNKVFKGNMVLQTLTDFPEWLCHVIEAVWNSYFCIDINKVLKAKINSCFALRHWIYSALYRNVWLKEDNTMHCSMRHKIVILLVLVIYHKFFFIVPPKFVTFLLRRRNHALSPLDSNI